MSQEDLANMAAERDRYYSALALIASGDCPPHDGDCSRDEGCDECLMEYARQQIEVGL